MSARFQPFDKEAEVEKTWRNLPHWVQAGCTYFVTFRLADALAQPELEAWCAERETWLRWNPRPWNDKQAGEYRERFGRRLEAALDAGHGSCILARPAVREVVVGALRYFDGERHALDEFVVMPNPVHVLVLPFESAIGIPACGGNREDARREA